MSNRKTLEVFFRGRDSSRKHIQAKSKKYGVKWQSYDAVATCNRCEKPFTPLRRKHHCRQCGLIYCSSCTSIKLKVEGSENLKRVCRQCANKIKSPSQVSNVASTSSSGFKQNIVSVIKRAKFFYNGTLEHDAVVTCTFDDVLAVGKAEWYRVSPGENGIDTLVYEEKILGAEDTMYKVKREDIGFKLKCVIRQGKTPALQKKNGVINVVTNNIVQRAVPTLASVAIQIGLRPHVHTLKCDRTTRICTAAGKYREGETLYVDPNIRGLETSGPVFIVCRFLRCKEKFDDYGNEVYGKHQATRDPQSLPFRNEVTMGKVLFSFREEKDNELGVEEGDILVLLDVPENSNSDSEWLICLGPRGKIGAVPRSFVKLYSMPVPTHSEIWGNNRAPELYGRDEPLCRYWRSIVVNFLDFETVAESNKVFEYNLGKADVGKLLVCEIEMFRKNEDGGEVEPLGKAIRSMPVGPIEPAPPRIDDLRITGVRTVGSELKAQYAYYGGIEGSSRYMWIRVNKDGSRQDLKATKSYTVLAEDLGCKIRVKVTPVRSCGMEGKPTASASIKIVEKSAIDDVLQEKSNPRRSNGTKNATKVD